MYLRRIPYRYLTRHPWQSLLMILGVALGVAVAVAIDLANASASRAFDLSAEAVAGRATHVIVGGPNGIPEVVYLNLVRSKDSLTAAVAVAPILSEYVSSPELGDGLLQLLGVDPFAEAPFRDYFTLTTGKDGSPPMANLVDFLTQPGAIILSKELADRYKLHVGDSLHLEIGGKMRPAFVAGLVELQDSLSRRGMNNLLLADIATAQELTGRLGVLDRIDMILPEKNAEEVSAAFQVKLPTGIRIETVAARTGSLEQMTAAFRVNLTALSLLALVVGLFLIYNTITLSVVQRRQLFGTLRCLGVTRVEIFAMVLSEAFLVGLTGTILGMALGVALGQGALRLVTRTINDLFFVVSVQGVQIPLSSLVKGAILGILASVVTAGPPAWEAASVPPRIALSRSGLEVKARGAVWINASAGIVLFAVGAGLLAVSTHDLTLSFVGTSAIVIGFAALAPATTILLARFALPVTGWLWGSLGRMGPRNVISSLSRTSVATAALMVAISVTIGVSLMIGSFRHTVTLWLAQILQGDIYLSAPSLTATQTSAPIDPQVLDKIKDQAGFEDIHVLRAVTVDAPDGPVQISATNNPMAGTARTYLSLDDPLQDLPARLAEGAVVVSEPFANRYNLPRHNGSIALFTDKGLESFPVAGIYFDYGSTQGTVLMSLDVYRQHWDDPLITAISLDLTAGTNADQLVQTLEKELNPIQKLNIRPNAELRSEVLDVFDRTFAITGALQLLATLVAFMGVLGALLSLELERQRELGIMRSIGMTARQMWGLIMLETGLLGSVAGLLAMPTGYVLSLILVYIINRRSFGWTLQMQITPEPFWQALVVAITAALLAGVYPAWRIGRLAAADAARFD